MALEIERRFLVIQEGVPDLPGTLYKQGYLSRDPQRTVRVRMAGESCWLAIKGERVGATRLEFEYSIPVSDAHQLMELCLDSPIEKRRFFIPFENHVWHVDQFLGENGGLVLAEIELQSEDEAFQKPDWIGREVTHEVRYYNSRLSICPFQSWLANDDSPSED